MADWNEGKPGDSDFISVYPANERAARDAVKTNFAVDHEETVGDSDIGKHKHVSLIDFVTDPASDAAHSSIYGKTVSGIIETFLRDSAGTIQQLTSGGKLALSAHPSSIARSAITITAGNGLSGGGDLTSNRTVTVGAGTGIDVGATTVGLDTTSTRNVEHSGVSITAGNGLSGGGTIAATRTLTVGAGTGIDVGATTVGLDTTNGRNADHSAISITAGTGLTGGGTIAATRTLNMDISGLTAMTVAPAGADTFLYNDGGTMKQMSFNQAAVPSATDAGAHAFTNADVSAIRYYTGTGGDTWSMNTGVGQNNCWVMVVNSGSGNLTIASGSATVSGAAGKVLEPDGVAVLIREATGQWFIGGTGLIP